MTLQEHVRRYMDLAARADNLFKAVERLHGDLMPCKVGCDDCCSVYFELSLIEAFVIRGMFAQHLSADLKKRALERADRVEPLFHQARKLLQGGTAKGSSTEGQAVETAAKLRIECPLKEDHTCVLYEHRPITCRIYGTPQNLGDRVVSCPRTGFHKGGTYSVVDVQEIQGRLYEYSRDFLLDLVGVAPSAPPGPLFSLAAALKTTFDKQFFVTLGQIIETQK